MSPPDEGSAKGAAAELAQLFERDLDALAVQLRAFAEEGDLWRTAGSIRNSAGTLAVHLAGNLSHFVGAVLGSTGYVRDRDFEFSGTPLSREELLRRIEAAREAVRTVVPGLDREALAAAYPVRAPASLGEAPSTRLVLMHLAGHLNYHMGQIDYHRRILPEVPPRAGAIEG